jgi:hypothetical protein
MLTMADCDVIRAAERRLEQNQHDGDARVVVNNFNEYLRTRMDEAMDFNTYMEPNPETVEDVRAENEKRDAFLRVKARAEHAS